MSIADNLNIVRSTIPSGVELVAVSKFHPKEAILEAYEAGQRIFGESRMQELHQKHEELPNDIEWHFIGHLQTNKVKYIMPYVHTIHSVDSDKLLDEIEKQASMIQKPIECLLEVHIAAEDAKYGFSYDDCYRFFEQYKWQDLKYAYLGGVMGMATNTDDDEQIRAEFRKLKLFFDELKSKYFIHDNRFRNISIGMSNDYVIAIEEGATMVRIGSTIFGSREY